MASRRFNILYLLWAFCFGLCATASISQNLFSSEEDLKKQANTLFEEEDFAKAYPLFSQLLSLYPKDAQYNYKFGTCLLFSSKDKEKAISYLEYAAKRQKQNVDKEVFFYLGKSYHLNYRFSDAIKCYTTYKKIASSKQAETYEVDKQIEMCESGRRLLKNVTELSVLEKKEVPLTDFFRSYNLTEFNAKLIIKPQELKTPFDKKKKDESLMYLAPDRNQIYYSSYGPDGKNGRDLYFVIRSPEGELSKPTRVSDILNTKYDEDFPFLHPEGKTLYFCSKGHNSMGGYDIFRSEWNNSTQSWNNPVNMDFPINTPDDDILFISDTEGKTAYFSSKRESAEGAIAVYKIKLERKPLELAIIKGTLTKKTGDQQAKATIVVTKILKDEVVGVFNTNAADGSYMLNLPNGGKFLFSVEAEGFKKSSEVVVIPTQQEIKPMKQEIELVNENGQDKIIIKNEFDTQVDSADMETAAQYIKAKASLEVSPEEERIATTTAENTDSLKRENTIPHPDTEKGLAEESRKKKNPPSVTNKDIIDMAYQDAKETQKDASDLRRNSESAKKLSIQKNELALRKSKEALELINSAEAITNQEEKIAQEDKAKNLKIESETFAKESALSLTLSNQMDELANAKQQQADAELKYAKDLDNAIKSGANDKKMNELLTRKEELEKNSEVLNVTFPPDMSKQINAKQLEARSSMAKYLEIQQDVEDLQGEAKRLHSESEKTTNESVKKNLIQQAEEIEKEADTKGKEAALNNQNAKHKQAEADSLQKNALFTSSLIKQIQSAPAGSLSQVTVSTNTASVSPVSPASSSNPPATNDPTVVASGEIHQQPNNAAINASPQVTTPPFSGIFQSRAEEAEKKTNRLEKAETLAIVYQSWTDSLDKQISILNKQKAAASTPKDKTQVQNKIKEFQVYAEENREKAANNRNKIDSLKLQEALAESSIVSPQPTSPSQTIIKKLSPRNLQIPKVYAAGKISITITRGN
jgi:WD40-like Beta Propeller Repeat